MTQASASLPDGLAPQENGRWGKAFLIVAGLHVLAVGIAAQWQGAKIMPPPTEMSIALDLAPMAAAERAASAAAAPASTPQPAPQPTPVPTERTPVVQPVTPTPVVAPQVPIPVRAAVAAAPMASGGPREAGNGPPSSGPSGAASASNANAAASAGRGSAEGRGGDAAALWRGRVLAHLDRHKRYPAAAKMMKREGRVHVRLVLDRSGHVQEVAVERGTGFPPFDREAIDTVRRADPLPPPPPEVAGASIPMQVPVGFYLPGSR